MPANDHRGVALMWWWVSTRSMTCGVRVEGGVVVESAPILKRFIGQPAKNLGAWLRKQGGFRAERLHGRHPPTA